MKGAPGTSIATQQPFTASMVAQKIPIAVQCAEIIRKGCRLGRWTGHLPSERKLSAELQVGRISIRGAIALLAREELVRISHGKPTQILKVRSSPPPVAPLSVALVTPKPLSRLRPFVTLWIDYLRSELHAAGVTLHVYEGQKYYDQDPSLALKALVCDNPHSAWLFYLTNQRMQAWVAREKVPGLILGYTYPELGLPFIVPDLHAVCRHAASRMLALGHRRILLLKPRTFGPGDWHSEQGFREAFSAGAGLEASPIVASPPENVTDFIKFVDKFLHGHSPPTAILVARTSWFFTLYSHLLSTGIQIPAQISLVARDDETFFDHLHPTATRYSFSAKSFAHKLVQTVLTIAHGRKLSRKAIVITPSLVAGGTLGPAPESVEDVQRSFPASASVP